VKIKYIVPLPLDKRGLDERAAQIAVANLAPDTEVQCVSVRDAPPDADSYYSDLLFDMYVVEAGLSAAEEGCDAVVIDTVSDSGLYPLRSRLAIPVVGAGMTAYSVATTLGDRFSVITLSRRWHHFYDKTLRAYRLWPRCASVRTVETVEPGVPGGVATGFPSAADVIAEAERAIRDDGADVIVLGSTTMHRLAPDVAAALDVPVINPGPLALKVAETLACLNLTHSKRAFAMPGEALDAVFHALPASARQAR
jgi:allantoin racemase